MKAAVFKGAGRIEVEEVPAPAAGPGEIVVAVSACGICGSDLHSYAHGSFVSPGQIMGHEFSGVVEELGAGVEGIAIGDRVTGAPLVACEECARCAEGAYNLCARAWSSGIAYGRPGAFAERLAIPAAELGRSVFELGEIDDEAGATVEPLAVAVHGVRLAGEVAGKTALAQGQGMIGQQAIQVLRAGGAARVLGADLAPLRLATATELGAEAIDGSPGIVDAARGSLAAGEEIDLVFECSGVPALAAAALRLVRPGGAVVVLALYDDPVPINGTALVQKEIRLQGSIAYTPDDFAAAVELLRSGAARADILVTQRESLDDIQQAFEVQLAKDRSLKVLVNPKG